MGYRVNYRNILGEGTDLTRFEEERNVKPNIFHEE